MEIHRFDRGQVGLLSEPELWERREEPEVRAELVNRFIAYAKSIAIRYRGKAETVDDLVQVASLGLMNAIDRFDPSHGTPFVSFASPTIHGELKRHFRDHVSAMKVPRGIYERIGKMDSVVADLRTSLSHEPGLTEIAEAMGCSQGEVLEARDATQTRNPLPFRSGDEEQDGPIEEHLGEIDGHFEQSEDRMMTREALQGLAPRDREIVMLRFQRELTQTEIAENLGCSQMQVSRRLRSILDALNQAVNQPRSC